MQVASVMTQSPRTIPHNAELDHVMEVMDEHDVRHLPVLRGGVLVGVISDRDVLEATGWMHPREREVMEAPGGDVESFMHSPVSTVSSEDSLDEALTYFLAHKIGCLPVVDDTQVVGIVSEMDLLRAYANACRRGLITPNADETAVGYMRCEPSTIDSDSSGDEAAAVLAEAGFRHLPVVKDGKLVGIVSDRDIRWARGRGQLEVDLVSDLMSEDVQTGRPDETLASIALLMETQRISALPIMQGDDLVGIVTISDILAPCAMALQQVTSAE